jgi:hypothetical protein
MTTKFKVFLKSNKPLVRLRPDNAKGETPKCFVPMLTLKLTEEEYDAIEVGDTFSVTFKKVAKKVAKKVKK